jgi:hypothetical protein
MGLDTKTYWLTDRQSQCNFNLKRIIIIIIIIIIINS